MSVPFLVKDIFPFPNASFDNYPKDLTVVGNTLYFVADNGVNGRELWKSDGTAAGTVLVKDIVPGSAGSTPQSLTAVGNTLIFSANDGVNGRELWKSNGTAAGTVLVKDIGSGAGPDSSPDSGGAPGGFIVAGNTFYFVADDGTTGGELWKSNGTTAGTVLVKDIKSSFYFPGSYPDSLTVVGNTLFFSAFTTASGRELWKSDGTTAGTVLVKDIQPGFQSPDFSAYPRFLTAVGNTLFFRASNDANGAELWKSDGTAAGTVLVKDVNPGSQGSYPDELTIVGNTLYFVANDGVNGGELWKSDGTAAGTILVKDIRTGSVGSTIRDLTAVGNTLYFTAFDLVNGSELWKSDGTAAGTVLVKDILPGFNDSSGPNNLTAVNNTLFFTANDGVTGGELWRSDGTTAGTVRVSDINPGSAGSAIRQLTLVGNTLFFIADDGQKGDELWALKLTTVGISTFFGSDAQAEGNTGAAALTFAVIRAGDTTITNTVNWAVTGSGINPANAADFVGGALPSGTVNFAPGETFKFIIVNIAGDTTPEGDETFTVNLSNATNGAIFTAASALGTILSDDPFIGGAGDDTLTGTAGVDTLIGLAGDDTYAVNNGGDAVVEQLNRGTDTVNASVRYTLPDNVENLILTGSGNINGTGNGLNNTLTGNGGANTLTGLDGNDTLDGKGGSDTLIGGQGNDTYTVDTIAALFVPGDTVIENANEGTDTVRASVSYTLPDNVENLLLTGRSNINGTGNALSNTLAGNNGNNVLNGGAGADTLTGGAGNDTFVFRFGQSTVTALDRITDFAIGADKIDLLTQGGAATGAPAGFTRAADSAAISINTIVNNVFADANGATSGNQALGLNRAAFVKAGTSTYLIVNDGTGGFQSANDLVINLTGITGTLPALGTIPVDNFFV